MLPSHCETLIGDNYHDIYLQNLSNHQSAFMFENAPRGLKQRERLFTTFTLTNPIERVCYLPERKTNIIFLFAEVLWYLKGDNSLEFIEYYCPRMRQYSKDGKTLVGSAYGPKIFSWNGCLNQWQWIYEELIRDPHSRRAVIHIRGPEEILIENNIDATCTLTLQFLNREGCLIVIGSMRSNDIYRGAISDVFSFTFLHELMAKQLGLKVGPYHHLVGSSHIYESDQLAINKVLAHRTARSVYAWSFPEMPAGDNQSSIHIVLEYEEALRQNKKRLSVEAIGSIHLPVYWQQIIALFEIQRQIQFDRQVSRPHYEYLSLEYQHLIRNRFASYLSPS